MQKILKSGDALFMAGMTFFIALAFSRLSVDVHHDGTMLKTAFDLVDGQVIHRDTFSMYGPLTSWIHAGFVLLVGKKAMAIKYATVFAYAIAAFFLFQIVRTVAGRIVAWLASMGWLFTAPFIIWEMLSWSSVPALAFQLIGIYCALIFFFKQKNLALVFAGSAFALAFLCRQPVGLLSIIAIFPTIVMHAWMQKSMLRHVGLFVAGVCLPFLAFFLYLGFHGAVGDWYTQNFSIPHLWAKKYGNDISPKTIIYKLFPIFRKANFAPKEFRHFVFTLFPVINGIIYLVSAFHLLRAIKQKLALEDKRWIVLSCLSAVAISAWHQYYPVTCTRHVWWGATPMFASVMVAAYYLLASFKLDLKIERMSVIGLALVLFAYPAIQRTTHGMSRFKDYPHVIDHPVLEGIRFAKTEFDLYSQILEIVREYPEHILASDDQQSVLFLTFGKSIPEMIPYESGDIFYPEQYKALHNFMDSKKNIYFRRIWGGENLSVFRQHQLIKTVHQFAIYRKD